MSRIPKQGLEIDGYRLVRQIGQGGFGSVWLCWSDATESYHALKWIEGAAGETERQALVKFREVSQRLRSPHLIGIEHINLLPEALIYTLPLADGVGGDDPADTNWTPLTLADYVTGRSSPWFSADEIKEIILPIIHVTASLNEAGLVHRDIKPANILFFGGVPCLADVGLLATDTASLTQRGTPGFSPPSWYLESSGQPDMWGLATTLYTLLTGNHPDKIGRAGYMWPPSGKDSLSAENQKEWRRLHSVIYRLTHEKASERYRDFRILADAVEGRATGQSQPSQARLKLMTGVLLVLVAGGLWLAAPWQDRGPKGYEPQVTFPPLEEAKSSNPLSSLPLIDIPEINIPEIDTPQFGGSENPAPRIDEVPAMETEIVLEPAPTDPNVPLPSGFESLDDEANHIIQRLEERTSALPEDLVAFQKKLASVGSKIRDYKPSRSLGDDIAESMASIQIEMDGDSSRGDSPDPNEPPGPDLKLLEIRDELQFLAANLPKKNSMQHLQETNAIYEQLMKDAYAKTATSDEKFYFNDVIRPKMDREFEQIVGNEPGFLVIDTLGVNLSLALMDPKWMNVDVKPLEEIEASINTIDQFLSSE